MKYIHIVSLLISKPIFSFSPFFQFADININSNFKVNKRLILYEDV